MSGMLWLRDAKPHDPRIDAWIERQSGPLGALAADLLGRLRGAGRTETIHDGHPAVCIDEFPCVYVGAFKNHVNLGFYHGATLPDPQGLLKGDGKRMRHVPLKPGDGTDFAAIDALIAAAFEDLERRAARR